MTQLLVLLLVVYFISSCLGDIGESNIAIIFRTFIEATNTHTFGLRISYGKVLSDCHSYVYVSSKIEPIEPNLFKVRFPDGYDNFYNVISIDLNEKCEFFEDENSTAFMHDFALLSLEDGPTLLDNYHELGWPSQYVHADLEQVLDDLENTNTNGLTWFAEEKASGNITVFKTPITAYDREGCLRYMCHNMVRSYCFALRLWLENRNYNYRCAKLETSSCETKQFVHVVIGDSIFGLSAGCLNDTIIYYAMDLDYSFILSKAEFDYSRVAHVQSYVPIIIFLMVLNILFL
ncbi:uncharacterized protein LOC106670975 [Cimex lectularius]|uniref:Uncharacterized protein n=1 Tax=Cimex lectularius TaxID=79782 RepID=A0A8I6S2W7_CIMLE|nr:uncharacterized protein LOC106670975 [Cimex lectularius]